eukprot:scaffold47_cov258-Pinguiococcus_pyrenoidosus.AAC.129
MATCGVVADIGLRVSFLNRRNGHALATAVGNASTSHVNSFSEDDESLRSCATETERETRILSAAPSQAVPSILATSASVASQEKCRGTPLAKPLVASRKMLPSRMISKAAALDDRRITLGLPPLGTSSTKAL